jgi:hypothetical protein
MKMDNVKIYDAINQEFGPVIALSVVQINTINLTSKVKKKDLTQSSNRTKRILKKAEKVLWELPVDDYNLIVSLWKVLHDWDVKQSLAGLGGCTAKTFTELLAKSA